MKETHARSITKGLSWRIIVVITTMTIIYLYTGDITITVVIGFLEFSVKIFLYYIHERAWGNVTWGKRE